jgi:2-polyprenyl-3-methyl-5-hydroxy-6-metoxy-1,4-benzoquinol methylase
MNIEDTRSSSYTERLIGLEGSLLKKLATPINPYRRNIRKLSKGRVLDVGCGIGRNLRYLNRPDALGIDHNSESVAVVNKLGYQALSVTDFENWSQRKEELFDSILISHVLEHLSLTEASELIEQYLPSLKVGGVVVAICPQEKGYESDASHKTFFSIEDLEKLLLQSQLTKVKSFSFPFPKMFGKLFIYNENIVVFRK